MVASFIQRVSGFGFGIFVMMFFPYILPTFGESITLSGLLAGTTSLIIAVRNWRYIRWNRIGLLLLTNVAVSYVAINFMAELANATLKKGLGVTLIVIALYFYWGAAAIRRTAASTRLQKEDIADRSSGQTLPRFHHHRSIQALMGSISGITGGMFAMPGPPIVLYCINAFVHKQEYIATLQTLFCCSNIFYTLFRARVGFFTEHTFHYAAIGLLGLFVGTWLGARLFEHISGPMLKRIVYGMMLVSGVVALC